MKRAKSNDRDASLLNTCSNQDGVDTFLIVHAPHVFQISGNSPS